MILSRWNPLVAVAASFGFGSIQALQIRLQVQGSPLPYQVFVALPYLVTILALAIGGRNIRAPRELGASEAHLAAGAAVLGNTSAPIGGDNSNCVIAGHRGWHGADYFRHIDRLQVGDTVTLTNLWETLTYTVAGIQIIQPHEGDKIKIQQGRDLLTLITCHPYASGGKQRYVVYCERTG